jgi:hypothetical protein
MQIKGSDSTDTRWFPYPQESLAAEPDNSFIEPSGNSSFLISRSSGSSSYLRRCESHVNLLRLCPQG